MVYLLFRNDRDQSQRVDEAKVGQETLLESAQRVVLVESTKTAVDVDPVVVKEVEVLVEDALMMVPLVIVVRALAEAGVPVVAEVNLNQIMEPSRRICRGGNWYKLMMPSCLRNRN